MNYFIVAIMLGFALFAVGVYIGADITETQMKQHMEVSRQIRCDGKTAL